METREKIISGVRYKMTMIPSRKALGLTIRLIKLLGPGVAKAIGPLLGGQGALAELMNSDIGSVGKLGFESAMESLADRIDEPEVIYIVDQLAEHTVVVIGDKQPQLSSIIDMHFAGKMLDMGKWLWFALGTQFGDFSGVLASVDSGDLQHGTEAPSPPQTSIG